MNDTNRTLNRPAKITAYFAFFALLLTILLLAWIAQLRMVDFRNNQQRIAVSTVENGKSVIASFIKEKKRLVQVFTKEYLKNIFTVYLDPENEENYQNLQSLIRLYFPDHFTFTITDETGTPIIDDFEGYVGDICVLDMQKYMKHNKNAVRIHPNPFAYHFDIMAKWAAEGKKGLFFVSFHPESLGKLIRAIQPQNHQLMLVTKDKKPFIEITASGARNTITDRDDYRLSKEEREHLLFSADVRGTFWNITDFHTSRLFTNYNNEVIKQIFFILSGILIVVLIMWRFSHFFEMKRFKAEQSLISSYDHINSLNQTLKIQNDQLEKHQAIFEEEAQLAKEVYEYITQIKPINYPYINTVLKPMSVFNGDVLLTNHTDNGNLIICLGDFTGHGLSAALGVIPLADMFYALTKNNSLEVVISKINNKLLQVLPIQQFCCAIFMEIDLTTKCIHMWNASQPDILVLRNDVIINRIKSIHPALSLKPLDATEVTLTRLELGNNDRLYAITDGILEELKSDKDGFGLETFENIVDECLNIESILKQVKHFQQGEEQKDDISLIEIRAEKMSDVCELKNKNENTITT